MARKTKRTKLSTEQLQERESRPINGTPTIKPLGNATQNEYAKILEDWESYADRLSPKPQPQNLHSFKGWLYKHASDGEGMITENISIGTLIQYKTRLKRAVELSPLYKDPFPDGTDEELTNYINNDLKNECHNTNEERTKLDLCLEDLEEYIKFLWTEDHHRWRFERGRVQLHLYLLICAYTAARPGAVIVSDAHRNSNETLCYKDFEYTTIQEEGMAPRKYIRITFRNMKFDREKVSKNLTMVLSEDLNFGFLCPISIFQGLATDDDAFEELPPPYSVTQRGKQYQVQSHPFKQKVRDQPVFISAMRSKAWTYGAIYNQLRMLGYRMGYEKPPTSYSIRRAAANVLNDSTSWADISKIMGHQAPKTLQKYTSSTPNVSLQALYTNQGADFKTNDLHILRRLNLKRSSGAPTKLLNEVYISEIWNAPHIVVLREDYVLERSPAARKLLVDEIVESTAAKIVELRKIYSQTGNQTGGRCPEIPVNLLRDRVAKELYNPPENFSQGALVQAYFSICRSKPVWENSRSCQRIPLGHKSQAQLNSLTELQRDEDVSFFRDSIPGFAEQERNRKRKRGKETEEVQERQQKKRAASTLTEALPTTLFNQNPIIVPRLSQEEQESRQKKRAASTLTEALPTTLFNQNPIIVPRLSQEEQESQQKRNQERDQKKQKIQKEQEEQQKRNQERQQKKQEEKLERQRKKQKGEQEKRKWATIQALAPPHEPKTIQQIVNEYNYLSDGPTMYASSAYSFYIQFRRRFSVSGYDGDLFLSLVPKNNFTTWEDISARWLYLTGIKIEATELRTQYRAYQEREGN